MTVSISLLMVAVSSVYLALPFALSHTLQECKESLRSGKYKVAADICQSVADSASKEAKVEALFYSADAQRAMSNSLASLRIFGNILEIDASNHKALVGKAEAALRLGHLRVCRSAASLLKDGPERKRLVQAARLQRALHRRAGKSVKAKRYKEAGRLYEELLKNSPDSSTFLAGMADCCLFLEDYPRAIDLLKREASLAGESSTSYFTLGKIHLQQGNLDLAKRFINGALRENPDLRPAMSLRTRIKQIEALLEEAVSKMLIVQSIQTIEGLQKELNGPTDKHKGFHDDRFPFLLKNAFTHRINTALCSKYSRMKRPEAAAVCRLASSSCTNDVDRRAMLTALVESLLSASDYEGAMSEAKGLQQLYPRDLEVDKLVKKVVDAHRKSKLKDYYAILEIDKSASKKDIQKAYKRLSKLWHPDKHSANPQPAEIRMKDINRAYEVLGDPDKRRTYDRTGYDPEDPEAQSHAGFGGGGGFSGFDFGGGQNFDFVFRDAQGREWRQPGGGQRQRQRQQQQYYYHQQQQRGNHKQQQQQDQGYRQWRWEDL